MNDTRTDLHGTGRYFRTPLWVGTAGLLLTLSCVLGVSLLTRRSATNEPAAVTPTFEGAHPRVGEIAPDFNLKDIAELPFHLSEHLGYRPLVIEFGSFT
jgi:hypothetical protein